jgi:hypothetical protein
MQQDLGGAAAEELEGVQLRSQSDANTRRGGSRIGRWGSGICGVGWSWAASRGRTGEGMLREESMGWNQPEVVERGDKSA